jgi:hypothetical protein
MVLAARVEFPDTSRSDFFPKAPRFPFMVSAVGILHGKRIPVLHFSICYVSIRFNVAALPSSTVREYCCSAQQEQ